MTSEQLGELVRGNADASEDAAQGPSWHIPALMGWHGDGAPVGMAHDMMAAVDPCDSEACAFKRPDDLRSRYSRDAARHKAANYQRSGNVECQRHLVWYPNLFNKKFQAGAQVCESRFLGRPVAKRSHARPELGGGTPDAILILLDDVGHVNDTSHASIIAWSGPERYGVVWSGTDSSGQKS